jgi:hypothetical protein
MTARCAPSLARLLFPASSSSSLSSLPSLRTAALTSLSLGSNALGPAGTELVAAALKTNQSLLTLDVQNNQVSRQPCVRMRAIIAPCHGKSW